MLRRKLHNTIQELKGNIRVFCRVITLEMSFWEILIWLQVRPLVGNEVGKDKEFSAFFPHNKRTLEIDGPSTASASGKEIPGKKWTFTFDKVFNPSATQGKGVCYLNTLGH